MVGGLVEVRGGCGCEWRCFIFVVFFAVGLRIVGGRFHGLMGNWLTRYY